MSIKKILLQLSILFVIWLVVFWKALASAVDVWSSSETYKHCFFILPLVAYLIYERRKELSIIHYRPNTWAIIAIACAFGLNLFGELLGINLLSHAAAYFALISIIWFVLGNEFFKTFWFPILFLGFAIPFGEELVPTLQDVTAYLTVELVRLTGIPIYRDGLYLYVPNGTFLVAEACAGIRFLIASFALGTLFSYLNYKTKWKFYGFIIVSLIVPILANGIRAFGIVAIGYSTDMEHAVGADHLIYGWFFFAFVLLLLFGLGQIGQEDTRIYIEDSHPKGSVQTAGLPSYTLVSAVCLGLMFYGNMINAVTANESSTKLRDALSSMPNSSEQAFNWQPIILNSHEQWSGTFDDIPIYIAYYQSDNATHELVSGLHRYFNIEVFTRKSIKVVDTEFGPVNRIELVDVKGNDLVLHYWFDVDGVRTASALKTKLNQAFSKLNNRKGEAFFVAVEGAQLSSENSTKIHTLLDIDN